VLSLVRRLPMGRCPPADALWRQRQISTGQDCRPHPSCRKSAAPRCRYRSTGQTDGRTDGRTPYRYTDARSWQRQKTESVQSRRLENRKRCMSRFSKIKRFERLERLLPQSVLTPRTPCRQLPFLLGNIRYRFFLVLGPITFSTRELFIVTLHDSYQRKVTDTPLWRRL